MSGKRWLAVGVLAAGCCVTSQFALAEDATPKKEDAPTAPTEAPKKKDPFFGDHFAMYLETRGGPASIDALENPVSTGVQQSSDSEVRFTGNKSGQFTVGWTLPRGRGQYLLTYNGISDGDYELDASGIENTFSLDLPWWHVTVRDGAVRTTQTPPVWNLATDDANGNTIADPSEVRYPTTTVDVTGAVPADLGNRVETWDLSYRREFGGLRIHARWQAGIRYLNYEGAIVTPSWLTGVVYVPGYGYSDGVVSNFILMQQATKGYGPMGSGEVQFNFFRQRLKLYGEVKAAFLVQSLSADSEAFTYYAKDTGGDNLPFPGAGHIHRDIDKTAWNIGVEIGARVRLLQGFDLIVDWNRTGYLDTFLVPYSISIPANASEAPLGTTARFVSRDFDVSVINLGLSFQF
jgi:hypothetical protein